MQNRRDRRQQTRRSNTERRRTARLSAKHTVQILTSLSIFNIDIESHEPLVPVTLSGFTKDISQDGITVIVPSAPVDERFCAERRAVVTRVDLESRMWEVKTQVVHCAPLNHQTPDDGYLLGLRILPENA
jgi:hypothetical protein